MTEASSAQYKILSQRLKHITQRIKKNKIQRMRKNSPKKKGSPISILRNLEQSSDLGFVFQKEKFNQGMDVFGISSKQNSHFAKYCNIKFGFNHFYKKAKKNDKGEIEEQVQPAPK